MQESKKVKDLMTDISDFPHMPYWFTIRQVMETLKKVSAGEKKAVVSDMILIFDEKYQFMGMVRHWDIVMGLEPAILKKTAWTGSMSDVTHHISEEALANIAESMFGEDAKKEAERQVNEIMTDAKVFVSPDDFPSKAAYLMAHHNLSFIPVIENKQKLIGMISMTAVFRWVLATILE